VTVTDIATLLQVSTREAHDLLRGRCRRTRRHGTGPNPG
jgi:hypothetical protein